MKESRLKAPLSVCKLWDLSNGLNWLGCGHIISFCETAVEPLGFLKDGKFLGHLSDYQFIKEHSAA
jgi:hypothetical protein